MSDFAITANEGSSLDAVFITEEERDLFNTEKTLRAQRAHKAAISTLEKFLPPRKEPCLQRGGNAVTLHSNSRDRESGGRNDRSVDMDGRVGVKISWGDSDGPRYEVNAQGSMRDKNGNYVEGRAQCDSDGKGDIEISAGHDSGNGK